MNIKLWIYAIIFAAVSTGWAVDRHYVYLKGKADSAKEYDAAYANERQRQKEKSDKEAAEAIKKASEVAEHITSKEDGKKNEQIKTRTVYVEVARPAVCDLNNAELLDFQQAISDSKN